MARPREFDATMVLEAAMNCFWAQGFEQTSVRDLAEQMGITGASLYNAFGDKRSLYRQAFISSSSRRCVTALPGWKSCHQLWQSGHFSTRSSSGRLMMSSDAAAV